MRSTMPMPGNPWPHDMVLRIDDDDFTLTDLIWVRHALALEPLGDDVPPAMWNPPVLAPADVLSDGQRTAAAELWLDAWRERLAGLAAEDERRASPELMRIAADPRTSHADLQRELRHAAGVRRWPRSHEQTTRWREPEFEWRRSLHGLAPHRSPEREIVEVTVAAWRRGLEHIVELPTVGEYTRTISYRTLMVTRVTRADSEAYAVALESFDP